MQGSTIPEIRTKWKNKTHCSIMLNIRQMCILQVPICKALKITEMLGKAGEGKLKRVVSIFSSLLVSSHSVNSKVYQI